MAQLYYLSLEHVGNWASAIKGVGAQLRPYIDYLFTAKSAQEARKPTLAWCLPSSEEKAEFQDRADERWSPPVYDYDKKVYVLLKPGAGIAKVARAAQQIGAKVVVE